MQPTPKRPREKQIVASAKLTRETGGALVYYSILGPNLYFSKPPFDGDQPRKIIITISYDEADCQPQPYTTPYEENNHGKTDRRT